jgi:hypothetical protein
VKEGHYCFKEGRAGWSGGTLDWLIRCCGSPPIDYMHYACSHPHFLPERVQNGVSFPFSVAFMKSFDSQNSASLAKNPISITPAACKIKQPLWSYTTLSIWSALHQLYAIYGPTLSLTLTLTSDKSSDANVDKDNSWENQPVLDKVFNPVLVGLIVDSQSFPLFC